ncbi:MAG: hypothetical protein Q9168_004382 [Polycauliona sp. 1 TL-2023]
MALIRLPNEILDIIIAHAVPEGFPSLVTVSKRFHNLCLPFIASYTALRKQFHHFDYHHNWNHTDSSIETAYDLIARIAREPHVARYVQHVDFSHDNSLIRRRCAKSYLHTDSADAVVNLLTHSPYFDRAGLDWQKYYAEIQEDVHFPARRYSQHAAAFLLTLLPNVKSLTLPRLWNPSTVSDKLVDAIVHKAKESHPLYSSLSQVTNFQFSLSVHSTDGCDLEWANPFLTLPCVKSFYGPSCISTGDVNSEALSLMAPRQSFATTLDKLQLICCCIDEKSIANFLKHTTQLKTLRYSHAVKTNSSLQDWNLCGFVTAIEQETGSHLEGLSITIDEPYGSISPGWVSLRGFRRLEKLELPLEIATCNINSVCVPCPSAMSAQSLVSHDRPTNGYAQGDDQTLLGDLVPATVSVLALVSTGTPDHAKALEVMFQDFAARREFALPALEKIFLTCEDDADEMYEAQTAKLLKEAESTGVILDVQPCKANATIEWDE